MRRSGRWPSPLISVFVHHIDQRPKVALMAMKDAVRAHVRSPSDKAGGQYVH